MPTPRWNFDRPRQIPDRHSVPDSGHVLFDRSVALLCFDSIGWRWGVFRLGGLEKTVTDSETIAAQQKAIEKLQRKVKRLETRLLKKQKFETEMLINSGATPRYINEIHQKDEEALSD